MISMVPFTGKVLTEERLELGEGPSYDALTDCLWWFDILGKTLCQLHIASGNFTKHELPFLGSVFAVVDDKQHLLASDKGLFLRDAVSGTLRPYVEIEPGKAENRSNDGRMHPSGALWIGTMSRTAETGAGAIYHVAGTTVTKLFNAVSIPNSICFSPDGTIGYFNDSKVNHLMRVSVDPATGLPTGEPSVLIDQSARTTGVIDGSVVDAEGTIWNANWDGGAVDRYAPDGRQIARYEMPARRVTCPAFFGAKFDRLAVTSCFEGLSAEALKTDPLAGATFELGIAVQGRAEPRFKL
uniref:SMP-30/gluconolactonase/LRE family protein n=1 Tax=uncultured Rhizobium sp. TaxID=155567 RepID=UPI002636484F|nr:SMP-30/gluconolactonase/LRE family protein [uncultured Rhizobium sp.]